MKKSMIVIVVLFILVMPLSLAATLEINSPDNIVQAQSLSINFSVNSDSGFDGTVYISYTNINSSIITKSFTSSDFSGTHYNYSWSIIANEPGTYSVYGELKNSSGSTLDSFNKTGTVNSSIPRITSKFPSGTLSENKATLSVKTNEVSDCKYDTTNNTYENLANTFTNTNSINHNQSLTGLSEGQHTYYIRCKDEQGYTMNTSEIISFSVDLPPTATIELSDETPVKKGTIEVKVMVSESLDNAPTLQYSFDSTPSSKKQVSLTGSGSEWTGYIIITESDDKKIGTFYFSAKDSSGNTGTKITSGNIFVVDTTKPPAPISVKATSLINGEIKLEWHYDDEEVDHFNIYRSTGPGVDYVDFYEEAENNSQQHIDKSTTDKVTYYYRITAVDKAGNEGALSSEVYATSVSNIPRETIPSSTTSVNAIQDTDEPKVLPPDLVPIVKTELKKIEASIIDIKNIIENIGSKDSGLVKDFKIKEQLESAKSRLQELKSKVESYKDAYATKSELEAKLKKADLEIIKIEKDTPRDISLIEETDFTQSNSKQDIENAVSLVFKDITLTENELKDYIKLNDKKKDLVKIDVNAKIINIEYMDGSKEQKSFISKKLSYEEPKELNDIIVIESIPKGIAESVDEITFDNSNYEILKKDPVVKFGFLNFDYQGEVVSYTLDKKIDLEELKNSRTVLLLSLNGLSSEDPSSITGFSIFPFPYLGLTKTQSFFIWLGIFIIIGLSAYYLLFVKGYKSKLIHKLNLMKLEHSINNRKTKYTKPYSNNVSRSSAADNSNSELINELYHDIKNAKLDMADKLYPLVSHIHNKLEATTQNSNPEIDYILKLITKAEEHIENKQHSHAAKIYPHITFAYQTLPKEFKADIYPKCVDLHRKIMNR